jgi:hypothetical protein
MGQKNFRLLVDITYKQGILGAPRRYAKGTVVGADFLTAKHEWFSVSPDMFEPTEDDIGPAPRDEAAEEKARNFRPAYLDAIPLTKEMVKEALREVISEMSKEAKYRPEPDPDEAIEGAGEGGKAKAAKKPASEA